MLKKILLDALFPRFCISCGKEGSLLCQDCFSTIEILEYQFCPFCNPPRRVFGQGKCNTHQKMNLSGLFAAVSYKNPLVKKLVTSFKYEPYLKTLAEPLTSLIISHFLLSGKDKIFKENVNFLLLPVPLMARKKRFRGFNQSEEIAKLFSAFFHIPLCINNLIKIKKTQRQVKLNKDERKENIKGVFALRQPKEILGKIVFLIDDVFTTGSTMEECAKVLKKSGAKKVWGIAIAREMLSNQFNNKTNTRPLNFKIPGSWLK